LSAGSLDPSFGGGGWTTVSPSGDSKETYGDVANNVAILPDGKILVGGGSQGAADAFGLVRLTPQGALDPTFGTGGRVRTDLGNSQHYFDMALQGDGKIVAVGNIDDGYQLDRKTYIHDFDQLLVRYNADGSLDSSFGKGGIVKANFSTYQSLINNDLGNKYDVARGVAIQSDGKIVVSGYLRDGPNNSDAAILVRYNPNGALDTTFGTGGAVIFTGATGFATKPWIQGDGKIVVSGWGTIARFNSDGTVDNGFGAGGIVSQAADVQGIQPDGKFLTVGTASNGVNDDIIVSRLNPDGTPDTTFGIVGTARIDAGGNEMVAGSFGPNLALGSDGSIVVVGYQENVNLDHSLIARLTPQGKPDEMFAPGGVIVQSFSTTKDGFQGVALQPDGRIVAVGYSTRTISPNSGDIDFLIARYLSNPTIGSFTANPNPVARGSSVTLSAGNVSSTSGSPGMPARSSTSQFDSTSSGNSVSPMSATDQLFANFTLVLNEMRNGNQPALSEI
jgi:uncharacterized delta-60 repeat protein